MTTPTFEDILNAAERIDPYLFKTPMYSYNALNDFLGAKIFIKHENYQPVGAFKVRGGINLVSQLSQEEKDRGVIAASTGNHGQSVAYSAQLFGVRAKIVVPEGANPGKVAAIRGMGSDVIFHGKNFDEARIYCEELSREKGYRYIHSGNEPHLIAGVGTHTLEILTQEPDIDIIIVPVGGGSGAAGACIAARGINIRTKIVGVQSEASPAVYNSWREKKILEAPNRTIVEGLATGTAFSLPQSILWKYLDDFILVKDEEILQAMVWMIEYTHSLAEGAGAAPLAAAYTMRDSIRDKKVALICSGGNTSPEQLKMALKI